jgi:serine/threonine protein kinase
MGEGPLTIGNYTLIQRIARRDGWTVWQGENQLTKLPVCVRSIGRSSVSSFEQRTHLFREIASIADIHHPFIAELFESFDDTSRTYLIFEWMENGSLSDYIATKGPLGEDAARMCFSQIIFALEYFHEERNTPVTVLEPDNIVFDRYNNVRLIDFGFRTGGSALPWAAPELVKGHVCGRACDIWSAGVILFTMLTGAAPFAESPDQLLSCDPVYPPTLGRAVVDLLKRMIVRSPEGRITLNGVKSHNWLSQTQYAAILEERFSQQRVNEAVIDKEVVRRMAALKLDVSALPQQLINRETTTLTAVYRQFVRSKATDAMGDLREKQGHQKPQMHSFKFQFPAAKKGFAGGSAPGRSLSDQSEPQPARLQGRLGPVKEGSVVPSRQRAMPLPVAILPEQRRMSKPCATRVQLQPNPTSTSSPTRPAEDH